MLDRLFCNQSSLDQTVFWKPEVQSPLRFFGEPRNTPYNSIDSISNALANLLIHHDPSTQFKRCFPETLIIVRWLLLFQIGPVTPPRPFPLVTCFSHYWRSHTQIPVEWQFYSPLKRGLTAKPQPSQVVIVSASWPRACSQSLANGLIVCHTAH